MAKDQFNPSRGLISRRELAERWGCSVETLKRKERKGLLRPVKLDARLLRYRLDDILALEEAATLNRTEGDHEPSSG